MCRKNLSQNCKHNSSLIRLILISSVLAEIFLQLIMVYMCHVISYVCDSIFSLIHTKIVITFLTSFT